jgi:hypothetical protein
MERNEDTNGDSAAFVSLSKWLQQVGVTSCTAWRWRKKGWLKVTNICGRLYLSRAAIAEFCERAEKGEFAQQHATPTRAIRGAE